MNDIIIRPFELRCPHCRKWTNIHCTEEELVVKSLNRICPHCFKSLNHYLPTTNSTGNVMIMELAHDVTYRRAIIINKKETL